MVRTSEEVTDQTTTWPGTICTCVGDSDVVLERCSPPNSAHASIHDPGSKPIEIIVPSSVRDAVVGRECARLKRAASHHCVVINIDDTGDCGDLVVTLISASEPDKLANFHAILVEDIKSAVLASMPRKGAFVTAIADVHNVHVFVDNSNFFIGARDFINRRQRKNESGKVSLDCRSVLFIY
jgi:hypothetical protein